MARQSRYGRPVRVREPDRINFAFVALMIISIAHILHRQYCATDELMLDTKVPLRRDRKFIVGIRQGRNAGRKDGHGGRLPVEGTDVGSGKKNVAQIWAEAEWRVGPHVVDVVALNALVEHSKAAAHDCLALARQV